MTEITNPAESGAGALALANMPAAPTLQQVQALEAVLRTAPEQYDIDAITHHHFADGVYGRELRIPAGAVLTGRIHRFETLNVLAQGEITVLTPDGMKRITAPAVFTSQANTKKCGYAHTDVVWINVHPTKLRDLSAIEQKFIVPETPAIEGEGA